MKVAGEAAPYELVQPDGEPLARGGVFEIRARAKHAARIDAVEDAAALAVGHDGVPPQVRGHDAPPIERKTRNSR